MEKKDEKAGAVAEVKAGAFGTKYLAVADPDALQVGAKFYAVPPAAVPVEALEGLVGELMARSNRRTRSEYDAGKADAYELAADELTALIKERSNG